MLISLEILTALQDFNTLDPLFMEAYLCNTQTHPMIYQKIYSLFMQIVDEYFSGKTFGRPLFIVEICWQSLLRSEEKTLNRVSTMRVPPLRQDKWKIAEIRKPSGIY